MGGIGDLAERDALSAAGTPVARSRIMDNGALRKGALSQQSQAGGEPDHYMDVRDHPNDEGGNRNGSD